MKTAVTESLKKGGGAVFNSTIGIDPTSTVDTAGEAGKTVLDHYGKLVDQTTDLKDIGDKGDIGSGTDVEETRDLLDM